LERGKRGGGGGGTCLEAGERCGSSSSGGRRLASAGGAGWGWGWIRRLARGRSGRRGWMETEESRVAWRRGNRGGFPFPHPLSSRRASVSLSLSLCQVGHPRHVGAAWWMAGSGSQQPPQHVVVPWAPRAYWAALSDLVSGLQWAGPSFDFP
jgi:hypothetical protein